MGRDHAIQCPDCLEWYSGFNGPAECMCPQIRRGLAEVALIERLIDRTRDPHGLDWESIREDDS